MGGEAAPPVLGALLPGILPFEGCAAPGLGPCLSPSTRVAPLLMCGWLWSGWALEPGHAEPASPSQNRPHLHSSLSCPTTVCSKGIPHGSMSGRVASPALTSTLASVPKRHHLHLSSSGLLHSLPPASDLVSSLSCPQRAFLLTGFPGHTQHPAFNFSPY